MANPGSYLQSHSLALARRLRRKDGKDLHKLWLELAAYTYGEPCFDTAQANAKLNRYSNALPDDNSLIKLLRRPPTSSLSEYINASYMDAGKSRPNRYVATQAPMPNTYTDFWRMVWQERMPVIVTLGQRIEDGKVKMHKYWPDEERTYAYITVVNISQEEALWPTEIEQKQFSDLSCTAEVSDARFAEGVHSMPSTNDSSLKRAQAQERAVRYFHTRTHSHTSTNMRPAASSSHETDIRDADEAKYSASPQLPSKHPIKSQVPTSVKGSGRRRLPTVLIKKPTRRGTSSPKSRNVDFATAAFTGLNGGQTAHLHAQRGGDTLEKGVYNRSELAEKDLNYDGDSTNSFGASLHSSGSASLPGSAWVSPAVSISGDSANVSVSSLCTSTSMKETSPSTTSTAPVKWNTKDRKKNKDKGCAETGARDGSTSKVKAIQSNSFDFTTSLLSKPKYSHKHSPTRASTSSQADTHSDGHTPIYVRAQSSPATTRSGAATDTSRRRISPLYSAEVCTSECIGSCGYNRGGLGKQINLARQKSTYDYNRSASGPSSPTILCTPPDSPISPRLRQELCFPSTVLKLVRLDSQKRGSKPDLQLDTTAIENAPKRKNAGSKTGANTDTKTRTHTHVTKGLSPRTRTEAEPITPRSPVVSFLARKVFPTQRSLPVSTVAPNADGDTWSRTNLSYTPSMEAVRRSFTYTPSGEAGSAVPERAASELEGEENGNSFLTVRYFRVTCSLDPDAEPLIVTQLQYNNWPDFGVPKSHLEFLTFRDRVTEAYNLACERHWLHMMRINAARENEGHTRRSASSPGSPGSPTKESLPAEASATRGSGVSLHSSSWLPSSQLVSEGAKETNHGPTGTHTETKIHTNIDTNTVGDPELQSHTHAKVGNLSLRKLSILSNDFKPVSSLASIASGDTSADSPPEPLRDVLSRTHSWQSIGLAHAYVEGSRNRRSRQDDEISGGSVSNSRFSAADDGCKDGNIDREIVEYDRNSENFAVGDPSSTQSIILEVKHDSDVAKTVGKMISANTGDVVLEGTPCTTILAQRSVATGCGSGELVDEGFSARSSRSCDSLVHTEAKYRSLCDSLVHVGTKGMTMRNSAGHMSTKCKTPSDCIVWTEAKCKSSSDCNLFIDAKCKAFSSVQRLSSGLPELVRTQFKCKSPKWASGCITAGTSSPKELQSSDKDQAYAERRQTNVGKGQIYNEKCRPNCSERSESRSVIEAFSGLKSRGWCRRPLSIPGRVSKSEGNLVKAAQKASALEYSVDVGPHSALDLTSNTGDCGNATEGKSESGGTYGRLKLNKLKRTRAKSAGSRSNMFSRNLSVTMEHKNGGNDEIEEKGDEIEEKDDEIEEKDDDMIRYKTKGKGMHRPRRHSEEPVRRVGSMPVGSDVSPGMRGAYQGVGERIRVDHAKPILVSSNERGIGIPTCDVARNGKHNLPPIGTDCISDDKRTGKTSQVKFSNGGTENGCHKLHWSDDKYTNEKLSSYDIQSNTGNIKGERYRADSDIRLTTSASRASLEVDRLGEVCGDQNATDICRGSDEKRYEYTRKSARISTETTDQQSPPEDTLHTIDGHKRSTSDGGFIVAGNDTSDTTEVRSHPHAYARAQSYAPGYSRARTHYTQERVTNDACDEVLNSTNTLKDMRAPDIAPKLWRHRLSAIVRDSVSQSGASEFDCGRLPSRTELPTLERTRTVRGVNVDIAEHVRERELIDPHTSDGVGPIVRTSAMKGSCLSNLQSAKKLHERVPARRTQSTRVPSPTDFDLESDRCTLEGARSSLGKCTDSSARYAESASVVSADSAHTRQPDWTGLATAGARTDLSASGNASLKSDGGAYPHTWGHDNTGTHSYTHAQAKPTSTYSLDANWTRSTELLFAQASATMSPLLVHCSAGLGRSGVYCAVDACLVTAREDGVIDVFGQVVSMRQRRPMAVQTEEQLRFIFDVLDACPSETGRP
ncbi:hypothetical protein SARC_04697 [Sphaeroforma arctica JP610]|uniref:Protein-tyrosine-phosphatase n=1 Tax=Sphaeroforma arctica JP610 TaxID=667725 RepID=A0A0L0G2H4_9EUKA|nr:hypothetical protein SARC_04697 [Sphaeroforma arctica JP610]KNC83026.1 hypothetical protein SARC_04697 [Sphaeroforma arctica JP610]|eukprot:XP_014156928.1 hypothetical protein SARC_04697 [Sphaeroforma arctica JP610]